MIFESKHSLCENYFNLFEGKELTFPVHLHLAFEYLEQITGVTEVTIGSKKYVLKEGEAILVFPLQPHAYQSKESGKLRLCVFSPDMVATFYRAKENQLPSDNRLNCVLPEGGAYTNLYSQKAITYLICGAFEENRTYVKKSDFNVNTLLVSLLLFAERNYFNQCLLRDAASSLGYDYAYISKFFKREVGISFRQYVNLLRVMEGKRLLLSSNKSIEEISEACGFSSLRAFDREFREQTATTPSKYRFSYNQG